MNPRVMPRQPSQPIPAHARSLPSNAIQVSSGLSSAHGSSERPPLRPWTLKCSRRMRYLQPYCMMLTLVCFLAWVAIAILSDEENHSLRVWQLVLFGLFWLGILYCGLSQHALSLEAARRLINGNPPIAS